MNEFGKGVVGLAPLSARQKEMQMQYGISMVGQVTFYANDTDHSASRTYKLCIYIYHEKYTYTCRHIFLYSSMNLLFFLLFDI